MSKWEDLEKELLSDPETKREYDRLAPRYAVISNLIEARLKRGLTQGELAEKIGTKQSAIARLEGGNVNPSLEFLQKIAQALGSKLIIQVQ
ncbi:MAG: helix-turn-helix transcriptional regulator [Candidatus Daviesbacteria bacterium]|nr:helix-turn-helix transcriptional regulator [Candidatus Daviesbacteria bacterium]